MAFDFYFAGSSPKNVIDIMLKNDANLLRSYLNDKADIKRFIEAKKNGDWHGKLLIDNGAFTVHRQGGTLDIDKYIEYINENDEYCDYFIALDEIPGKWGQERTREEILHAPLQTWENYLYMIEKVNKPEKLLPVFHQGDDFKWLEKILTHPTPKYICISGNKELTNKRREAFYKQCYEYINRLNPNIKVHCLGSATMSNVEKFPFTSMDSTTYIMTGVNGNILMPNNVNLYVGDCGKSLTPLEKKAVSEYISQFGYTLDDMGNVNWTRLAVNFFTIKHQSDTIETKYTLPKTGRLF